MSIEIKTILYATDLGDHMVPVFRYALGIAEKFGATISMFHVNETFSPQVRWAIQTYMPGTDAQKMEREGIDKLLDQMKLRLADFCTAELGQSPQECGLISDVSVLPGRAAETIVKVAEDRDLDLIVVGTHTDPSLGAHLLGSTARKVTQLSRKPVLVVPVYD